MECGMNYDAATMVVDGTELWVPASYRSRTTKAAVRSVPLGAIFLFFFKQTVQLSCRNIIPTKEKWKLLTKKDAVWGEVYTGTRCAAILVQKENLTYPLQTLQKIK
jgi:hypothetical protein